MCLDLDYGEFLLTMQKEEQIDRRILGIISLTLTNHTDIGLQVNFLIIYIVGMEQI
jgi:hypothetical protein